MIIAVDFDGTICADRFPEIGEPLFGAVECLKKFKENGYRLILYTCREDSTKRQYLSEAVEFCQRLGLEFDAVNANVPGSPYEHLGQSRKPYADWYIDDKAIKPEWNAFFG